MYFEDESRFGLFTRNGRTLTKKGVKPVCRFQQVFKSTWLFGAVSPVNGDSFFLELPKCNSATFEIFLKELSDSKTDELKVIIVDNAAFHKAKKLKIPDNIVLIFQPPYNPEVNPAEKIWAKFKRNFTNKLYQSLDEISLFIEQQVNNLTENEVISITRYGYIKSCLDWTIL